MKKLTTVGAITLTAFCTATTYAENTQTPQWGYDGANDPSHWAQLSPDYDACSGNNQSPVNLTGFVEAELKPIQFNYVHGGNEILNNGHTVEITYAPGSHITVDDIRFKLVQFHFHAPSENNINGKSYPLESHLVHQDKNGNLAVVAVMFTKGAENKTLARAWNSMPTREGSKHGLSPALSVNGILPEDRDYYRFNGSLTTPPCSEGVRWFVMKETVSASIAQINAFKSVMQHPNNRPLQAVNARSIMQ